MEKKQEFLEKIQQIKHDFSKLIPTTIELMFDACLGILYEEFAFKVSEIDARQKGSGESMRLGLLRAQAEMELKRNRAMVEHLKERVTAIYTEVKVESEKHKEDPTKNVTRRKGPNRPPTAS